MPDVRPALAPSPHPEPPVRALSAIERSLDAWGDLIASMARTQALVRKTIDASNAALAEINRDRAARGLPPVGDE